MNKLIVILICCSAVIQSNANEFSDALEAHISEAKKWISNPIVISAIKSQNIAHTNVTNPQIIDKDKAWRAEVGAADQPMISEILANDLSKYLMQVQEDSAGLYTEVFVMDNKGMNVGQSAITSDYWQGDEAKWKESYGKGAGSFHIGEVEEDESTQTFQSQLSISIEDPENGNVIGAVTIGVNVGEL